LIAELFDAVIIAVNSPDSFSRPIEKLQVFKRDKEKYNLVRKLKWGDIIKEF
jgi:hypothetical protein